MRIWKFPLQVTDRQTLLMDEHALLLDVQVQHGTPCLWAMCDENKGATPRRLAIYGTGTPIPDSPGIYIATFQMHGGSLVFHVFDITGFEG
jgi:hypothetical protein